MKATEIIDKFMILWNTSCGKVNSLHLCKSISQFICFLVINRDVINVVNNRETFIYVHGLQSLLLKHV